MADQVTARLLVEQPCSPARPQARQPEAKTTLTVPAKPAAITGANVATLLGTAAAAAGPVGWAVAGASAAVAGGAYAVRRRHLVQRNADGSRRSSRIIDGTVGTGWGLRLPRRGRSGSASPRSRAGAKGWHLPNLLDGLPGLPHLGGPHSGRTAKTRGGGAAGGSKAKARGRGERRRFGSGGHAGDAAGGRVGARGLVRPGLRRRLAALDHRIAQAAAKPGQAALDAAARRRAAHRKARAAAKAKGQPDPGLWRRSRRWVRRNVLGLKDEPAARPTAKREPKPQPPPRRTGDRVERPTSKSAGQSQPRTSARPDRVSNTEGTPNMAAPSTSVPQPSSPLFEAARRVHATAASYKPKGRLYRRQEAYEMPHTLGEIAKGLRLLAQTHIAQEPLNPAYAAAVQQIAACVDSAAEAARRLGPAFDGLHPTEVARLIKPRAGEDKWDVANNRP